MPSSPVPPLRRLRPPAGLLAAMALGLASEGRMQDEPVDLSLDGLLNGARELLDANLKGDTLTVNLPEPDPEQAAQFFRDFQDQLEGEYVVDLLPFKTAADVLLPLLEAHEPLQDLGAWLRARRDYFDAIDELQLIIPPASSPSTNPAPETLPAPPATNNSTGGGTIPVPAAHRNTNAPTATASTSTSPTVTVEVVLGSDPDVEPGTNPARTQTPARSSNSIPRLGIVRTSSPPASAVSTPTDAKTKGPKLVANPTHPTPTALREVWQHQLANRAGPARAAALVPRLKPIFTLEGVPGALVWLAEVESGFDPRARSPVGALGLYQLMPATARGLGLSTFPFDERKDPEKSARAAARLLFQLHERFGDWRLALAAYNAGPTRVQNLLQAHKAKTFEEIATRLPAETQLYVPKVEATIQRREGVRLSSL